MIEFPKAKPGDDMETRLRRLYRGSWLAELMTIRGSCAEVPKHGLLTGRCVAVLEPGDRCCVAMAACLKGGQWAVWRCDQHAWTAASSEADACAKLEHLIDTF